MTPIPAQDIQRILITRLRFLGDVVLSTPLVRAVRQAYPKAHLAYLAEKPYPEIMVNNPALDELITLERKEISSLPLTQRAFAHAGFIKKLRNKDFDLVLDLLGNPRSGLLTLLTGAEYRIGPYRRGRAAYYTHLVNEPSGEHDQIHTHLGFLEPLGIDPKPGGHKTEVFLTGKERDEAQAYLKANHLNSKPLVIIHPGASWPAKRWLPERFALVAERLKKDLGASVLLLAGPEEHGIVREVVQHMKEEPPVAEGFPIRKLCALLEKADLFLTNDAGPMHIACALGRPCLALFGPGDPRAWFPYKPEEGQVAIHHPPECWPCHQDECREKEMACLKAISVDEVVKKAKHLLAQSFPARREGNRLVAHA